MTYPRANDECPYVLGYQKKNEARNFREFDLNLISNNFCALASKLLYTQEFEHEIWSR